MIDAWPLQWPISQPRTPRDKRADGRFQLTMVRSLGEITRGLHMMGARDVVISSDCPVKRDGLPYANAPEPADPGVAVYFTRKGRPFVLACDQYRKLVWNVRAIAVTLEALRTIERHGSSRMMEQAFTGFAALPAAEEHRPWWVVLGVTTRTVTVARAAYLELCKIHHPDVGGDAKRMSEINRAYEEAKADLAGEAP